MSKIPTFASRCPNCISDGQGSGGRLILLLLLIGAIIFIANAAPTKKSSVYVPQVVESIAVKESEPVKELAKPESKPSYVIVDGKQKDKEELKSLLKEVGYFKKEN
jgi:hypothetical protein